MTLRAVNLIYLLPGGARISSCLLQASLLISHGVQGSNTKKEVSYTLNATAVSSILEPSQSRSSYKNEEKRHIRRILARFWNRTCKEKSLKLKKHKRQNNIYTFDFFFHIRQFISLFSDLLFYLLSPGSLSMSLHA